MKRGMVRKKFSYNLSLLNPLKNQSNESLPTRCCDLPEYFTKSGTVYNAVPKLLPMVELWPNGRCKKTKAATQWQVTRAQPVIWHNDAGQSNGNPRYMTPATGLICRFEIKIHSSALLLPMFGFSTFFPIRLVVVPFPFLCN